MQYLCSLKIILMILPLILSVNVGETKYFTSSKKWEAISHGKAFMNNQEVQQIAKGKKQETHKHLKVLIGVQKPTS